MCSHVVPVELSGDPERGGSIKDLSELETLQGSVIQTGWHSLLAVARAPLDAVILVGLTVQRLQDCIIPWYLMSELGFPSQACRAH